MSTSCICSHVICLDWYDGPVRAVARYTASKTILMTMIDADDAMEKRAFAVREIQNSYYDGLLTSLSKAYSPKYPIWVPSGFPEKFEVPDSDVAGRDCGEIWITDRVLTRLFLRCPLPVDMPRAWSWDKGSNHGQFIARLLSSEA